MKPPISDMIVPYCERLSTGAEPVNTLSNVAFLLVTAYAYWRMMPVSPAHNSSEADRNRRFLHPLLAALPLVIAMGSALFHWRPSITTQVFDLLPIALFACLAAHLIMRDCLRISQRYTTTILAAWIIASVFMARWPTVLAGSLFYLPAVLLMGGLAIYSQGWIKSRLWLLTGLFTAALGSRAADLPWCQQLPGGTHVYWHLLAATASLLCLQLIFSSTTKTRALPQPRRGQN